MRNCRNIINVENYTPVDEDKFLIDANIWIYLFEPLEKSDEQMQEIYTNFFDKLRKANCNIYVTAQIISEFINKLLRIEFQIYKDYIKEMDPSFFDTKKFEFNDYKQIPEYKKYIKYFSDIVKTKILMVSNRLNDQFDSINMDEIFNNIEEYDFNDKYYIHLAENDGIKILTNDKGFFKNKSVTIVSAKAR